jgi:catechol 2,3-dioxygenase-like lactoylglutathione lyase family enzyme
MAASPQYSNISHISLTVRDVEASKRFYGEQLGLPVHSDTERPDHVTPNPAYDGLYHAPHDRRRQVVLGPVGGVSIALIGHPGDELQGSPVPKLDQVGLSHFALHVDDLPGLIARMASFDVHPVAQGYFQDPDGNLVQLEG